MNLDVAKRLYRHYNTDAKVEGYDPIETVRIFNDLERELNQFKHALKTCRAELKACQEAHDNEPDGEAA